MLFNSISFAFYLPLVFSAYWLLGSRWRGQNFLLLVSSYLFYGWWDWRYLLLIAGCSAVNFYGGRIIYDVQSRIIRRLMLIICCMVCLGALGVFKYYNFFVESFVQLFACLGIHWSPYVLSLTLPVGISFFTFQALSYTIDIALGNLKPTKDWVEFFVFISFFPQLVAGPIERASNLLPQFQKPRRFDFDAATHGVCLIAYGLFKKMVVADALSQYVDHIWNDPLLYGGLACAVGVVFFAVQIYCDFSGYSDVARGVAKLFGFELMLNFDRPYLSRTFSEFWRRWHISLSSWFKDYVYIPLGGNRVPLLKLIRNIWIVFVLSGLWHGASWAFIAWGALHAAYLTFGLFKRKWFCWGAGNGLVVRVASVIFVDVGVAFAWIFFRSGTIVKSVEFLRALGSGDGAWTLSSICAGFSSIKFAFCLIAIGLLTASYFCPRDCNFKSLRAKLAFTIAYAAAIVVLGMPSGGEFIYFRF